MMQTRGKVGEFLLILVSVFLALVAERWVAGRSDRNLAVQYESDLIEDLRSDSLAHATWTLMSSERRLALHRLLADLNETAPRLSGAEELTTLYYAQIVPIPNFQRATFQDLIGSGNLRLLAPTLRRSIVRYHAALDQLSQNVGLTELGKPKFADLVPAQTRRTMTGRCAGQPSACGLSVADSILAQMPAAEVAALESWREMPEVRLELQRVLNETNSFRRGFERVGSSLWEALGAIERSNQ